MVLGDNFLQWLCYGFSRTRGSLWALKSNKSRYILFCPVSVASQRLMKRFTGLDKLLGMEGRGGIGSDGRVYRHPYRAYPVLLCRRHGGRQGKRWSGAACYPNNRMEAAKLRKYTKRFCQRRKCCFTVGRPCKSVYGICSPNGPFFAAGVRGVAAVMPWKCAPMRSKWKVMLPCCFRWKSISASFAVGRRQPTTAVSRAIFFPQIASPYNHT